MEKVDLLVHIQKVQLELNQLKKRQSTSSAEKENNEKVVGELRNELAIKENECKTWMAKIEQADSLADDLRSKDKIIEELNSSLNFEANKRKQIESMFQDLTDREKIVKQELDQSKSQKVSTPETRFSDPRFSEILDLVNKTQLPSYFTKYHDSI